MCGAIAKVRPPLDFEDLTAAVSFFFLIFIDNDIESRLKLDGRLFTLFIAIFLPSFLLVQVGDQDFFYKGRPFRRFRPPFSFDGPRNGIHRSKTQ